MIGNAFEYLPQAGFRIESVSFAVLRPGEWR
jgi:hypothetical protein